jgi:flagellar L-ring protein precursor FlgH
MLAALGTLALPAGTSCAQNLYDPAQATQTAAAESQTDAGPALTLTSMSLTRVEPPAPREFARHDLITIIVDEVSRASASQSLDTEKQTDADISATAALDPWQLLELRLRQGNLGPTDLLDFDVNRKFEGEGEYDRTDRVNARITAEVVDVKPNGTIVIEARKVIQRDEEIQTLILTGIVRKDDVTRQNTVSSSQVAELAIRMDNEGQVREAARKGIITRVLDALFAF